MVIIIRVKVHARFPCQSGGNIIRFGNTPGALFLLRVTYVIIYYTCMHIPVYVYCIIVFLYKRTALVLRRVSIKNYRL